MAERTSTRGRADPRASDAEELVEVNLRRSVRPSGSSRFYGPGPDKVPRSLYESLKLSPDLVQTDGAGNPLPNTVAASVFGGGTSTPTVRDAHPTVHRDEGGDAIEDSDENGPQSEVARRSAAIAENAEKGPDRQGGQLAGESGSLEQTRELQPLPGQEEPSSEQRAQLDGDAARDAANARSSGSAGGGKEAKPLTKTQLRELDDKVLDDLARRNRVDVPKRGGKKALIDKLHAARVTLD